MNALLRLEGVQRHFGGIRAVDDVGLEIAEGSVFGLIGPNGAGKTTLVNLITGQVPLQSGSIRLGEIQVAGQAPHRIAQLGVARTFQTTRLYRGLSVLENMLIGMHTRRRHDTARQMAPLPFLRRAERERAEEAREVLGTVGLDAELMGRRAGTLAHGDQRRLELARALALRPRLLILDEPAAGMNPTEKEGVRHLIQSLSADGLTILLIDHDMRLVMGACQRIAVLNFGRRIAEGSPAEVASDPVVVSAYLGAHGPAARRAGAPVDEATRPPRGRREEPEPALLQVDHLSIAHGAIEAVHDVSLEVARGEIVALIGANGAGKTTTLSALSGLIRPRAGRVIFDGLDLTTASPARIVRHGLVQIPEGREILARQTVRENLELGAWTRHDGRAVHREIEELMDRFPILGRRRDLPAGQLSGGEQQILAIARGLLGRPRLLLLDEPSLGLAPQMVDTVFEMIAEIHRSGTTILLVEQNALRALEIADRGYVIETGRILLSGTGEELGRDPSVRKAYLGG